MAAGRLAREVWATKPLSDFVGPLLIPGETLLPPDATEEQWKSVLTSTGIFFLPFPPLLSFQAFI